MKKTAKGHLKPRFGQSGTDLTRVAYKTPLLEPEEECRLARAYRDHGDQEAGAKIVRAHMRLALNAASYYRGYGFDQRDLESQAFIGLQRAMERFDPDKGVRFSTFALWWVRAEIQEFLMRNYSVVKMGTTAEQKKLFFNLRKAIADYERILNRRGETTGENPDAKCFEYVAKKLDVTPECAQMMFVRMQRDGSLNMSVRSDAEGSAEFIDFLEDDSREGDTDDIIGERQETDLRRGMLLKAFNVLTDRERDIIIQRRLQDEPATLEDLSKKYDVSRERIRQIEVRAFEKLQGAVIKMNKGRGLVAAL